MTRRKKAPPTKQEAMAACLATCLTAFDRCYRHPAVLGQDVERLLAALVAFRQNKPLRVVSDPDRA